MTTNDRIDGREVEDVEVPQAWDQVDQYLARRVRIEQAKGMLMLVYGIDADDAFEILRWQSQQHNVKLRLIAEQILSDLVELSQSKGPAAHVRFDGLMLTAHTRITSVATRQRHRHSTANR